MTVIAARKTSDGTTFAADTLITDGYHLKSTSADIIHSKLFQHNDLSIGSSGDCFEATLMELFTRNHKPVDSNRLSVIDFLVEFREWVRKKEGGYNPGNMYLLAFDQKLFYVCGGLQVYEVQEFEAIGAGADFARAAMHLGHTAREAVEVACKLSVWCSEPITELMVPSES